MDAFEGIDDNVEWLLHNFLQQQQCSSSSSSSSSEVESSKTLGATAAAVPVLAIPSDGEIKARRSELQLRQNAVIATRSAMSVEERIRDETEGSAFARGLVSSLIDEVLDSDIALAASSTALPSAIFHGSGGCCGDCGGDGKCVCRLACASDRATLASSNDSTTAGKVRLLWDAVEVLPPDARALALHAVLQFAKDKKDRLALDGDSDGKRRYPHVFQLRVQRQVKTAACGYHALHNAFLALDIIHGAGDDTVTTRCCAVTQDDKKQKKDRLLCRRFAILRSTHAYLRSFWRFKRQLEQHATATFGSSRRDTGHWSSRSLRTELMEISYMDALLARYRHVLPSCTEVLRLPSALQTLSGTGGSLEEAMKVDAAVQRLHGHVHGGCLILLCGAINHWVCVAATRDAADRYEVVLLDSSQGTYGDEGILGVPPARLWARVQGWVDDRIMAHGVKVPAPARMRLWYEQMRTVQRIVEAVASLLSTKTTTITTTTTTITTAASASAATIPTSTYGSGNLVRMWRERGLTELLNSYDTHVLGGEKVVALAGDAGSSSGPEEATASSAGPLLAWLTDYWPPKLVEECTVEPHEDQRWYLHQYCAKLQKRFRFWVQDSLAKAMDEPEWASLSAALPGALRFNSTFVRLKAMAAEEEKN